METQPEFKTKFPPNPGQGKRRDQYIASAKIFFWTVLIYGVFAIGTLLWNSFAI